MVVLVEEDRSEDEGVLLKDKKATAMLVTGLLKTATTTLVTPAFSNGDFKDFSRDDFDEGHHRRGTSSTRTSTTRDIDYEGHRRGNPTTRKSIGGKEIHQRGNDIDT